MPRPSQSPDDADDPDQQRHRVAGQRDGEVAEVGRRSMEDRAHVAEEPEALDVEADRPDRDRMTELVQRDGRRDQEIERSGGGELRIFAGEVVVPEVLPLLHHAKERAQADEDDEDRERRNYRELSHGSSPPALRAVDRWGSIDQ